MQAGRALATFPGLRAEVTGPAHVPYGATVLGLNGSAVTIRLTNTTRAPLAVATPQTRFAVERAAPHPRIAFRCDAHDDVRAHEPRILAPGQSFVFERTMHCWTPLPGKYDVSVILANGDTAQPEVAGTFVMSIGDSPRAPRALPGRPGLFATMTSELETRATPLRDGMDGYYAVFVAVNGTAHAQPGGMLGVSLVVRRKGSDYACAGQAAEWNLPAEIPPGGVEVLRVPITCLRGERGEYVVAGELNAMHAPAPLAFAHVEVGRVDVHLTTDPIVLWPMLP